MGQIFIRAFRHSYLAALFLITMSVSAQNYTKNPGYFEADGYRAKYGLQVPRRDTIHQTGKIDSIGTIVYRPQDSSLYVKSDTGWAKVGSGFDISGYYTKSQSDSRYPLNDSLYHPLDTLNNWILSGPVPSLISNNHTGEGFVENIGGDTLINIFRSDSLLSHASNGGKIVQRYSYDGGLTWTTPTTIFNSSNDDRNVIGTITATGRIVTIFRQFNVAGGSPVSVGFITSTDKGQTWSSYTTLPAIVSGLAPMGNIVRAGDGSYLALLYTTNYCEAFRSTTNGASWTSQGVVYDFRVSNPTRQTSEPYAAYAGSNRMIMIVRNENLITGPYYQLNSIDNGQTFTWQGTTNIGGDTLTRTAPFITWDSLRNTVITIGCQRHVYSNSFTNNYRDSKNDSLVLYLNHPNDIFSTPTGYTQKASFVRPEPGIRGFYGYPAATQLRDGTWVFMISDENALAGIDPDGNDGKSAHLFQFDLMPIKSYYDLDSCRYAAMVKQHNALTGKYDNVRPYSQWVRKADSTLVNLANATIKIIPPMWGDTASAIHIVGRNDNAIKFNIRGDGFTDIYSQIKIRGGNPGVNKVLTSDANGLSSWATNDIASVLANGGFANGPLGVYGNIFARWYKFINQGNTSEPAQSPFFRFDETVHNFLWGNQNRSSMAVDTLGNLKLFAALKPNGLPGSNGDLLISQGDNVPSIWSNLVKLATTSGIKGTGTGNTNLAVFTFYESDGTTAKGAVGDGASGDADIYLSSTSGVRILAGGSTRINAASNGLTAFGSHTPTAILDVNAATGYNQFRLRQTYTPTSTADTNGNTGDFSWDANFFYMKTAAGWKRAALSTF